MPKKIASLTPICSRLPALLMRENLAMLRTRVDTPPGLGIKARHRSTHRKGAAPFFCAAAFGVAAVPFAIAA